jgi:flagellin-like protein
MKSITPVISIILLVALTITASGAAYFFIMSTTTDLQSGVNINNNPMADSSRLNLVSITGSKAIVRNDGTSPVTEVVMFVNNELLNYTLDTPILPGEYKEISFTAQEVGEDLEIKIIYNSGKTVTDVSLAKVNTEASGFIVDYSPRVTSVSIIQNTTHLNGYCLATVHNVSIESEYYYEWLLNDESELNGSLIENHDDFNYLLSIISIADGDWKFKCQIGNGTFNSSWKESDILIVGGEEPDNNSVNCLANDSENVWFTGTTTGNNSACCGDDDLFDDFYNGTNYCCNGILDTGTCHCGDGTCMFSFEDINSCSEDCYCGNNVCDNFENSANCPEDCTTNDWLTYKHNFRRTGYYNLASTSAPLGTITWPQSIEGSSGDITSAVADFDRDGILEIVTGSHDNLYIFYANGTIFPGWPQYIAGTIYSSSPVITDFDGDNIPEIIIGDCNAGLIYVFYANGSNYPGWPLDINGGINGGYEASVTLGDLDGDGIMELAIAGQYSDHDFYIHYANGSVFPGWPQTMDSGIQKSSAAFEDFDNDGTPEIVVASVDDLLHIWYANGTYYSGWPVTMPGYSSASPAIADLDGDGVSEIIINMYGVNAWPQEGFNTTIVYYINGSIFSGWPKTTLNNMYFGAPLVVDINNNNDFEIIAADYDGNVYAWHHNGTIVSGWPQTIGSDSNHATPSAADLDGDGYLELIFSSGNDWNIHILYANGTVFPGWPQTTGTGNEIRASPITADLNGDGSLEIIVTSWADKLHIWNSDGTNFGS